MSLQWVQPADAGPYGISVAVPLLLRLQQRAGADGGGYPVSLAFRVDGQPGPQTLMRSGTDYGPLAMSVQSLGSGSHTLDAGYAGLSATALFTVDAAAATVEVKVQGASHPTWVDPAKWRRDERPLVLVAASEALGSAEVYLAGSDAGVTRAAQVSDCLDAGVQPTAACVPGGCVCFRVDSAVPTLSALAGSFAVKAAVTDLVGNPTLKDGPVVDVTRQRWVVNVVAGVGYPKGGPAIGNDGTVYVGTSTGITALSPEGVVKWDAGVGAVEGSVAVGTTDAGVEYIFFAANKSGVGGYIQPLDTNGQLQGAPCNNSAGSVANASPALSRTSVGLIATEALNLSAGAAKLVSTGPSGGCLINNGAVINDARVDMDPLVNLVMKGDTVWVPANDANIRAFKVTGLTWSAAPEQGYPISLAAAAAPFLGLAMRAGGTLIAGGGAGIGQAFEFSTVVPDAGTLWRQPLATTAAAGAPAVGSSGLFHGFNLSNAELRRVPFDGGAPLTSAVGATAFVQSSPVVGAGASSNFLYWVTKPGVLLVTDEALAGQWSSQLGTGQVVASPNLDCNRARPGGPGILYVASTDGSVYSLLVDSPKLAATDWPKWQHDAQNSGNPDFPLNAGCQ